MFSVGVGGQGSGHGEVYDQLSRGLALSLHNSFSEVKIPVVLWSLSCTGIFPSTSVEIYILLVSAPVESGYLANRASHSFGSFSYKLRAWLKCNTVA